jgi:hypothetical protein
MVLTDGISPWFVVRNKKGELLDADMLVSNRELWREKLKRAISLRQTQGYREIRRISEWQYRVTAPTGEIEDICIQEGPP